MKGIYLYGAATAALFAIGAYAHADPMPAGVLWLTTSVVCDTKAQLLDVVTAGQDSFEKGKAKFAEYYNVMNDVKAHTCGYGEVGGKIVGNTPMLDTMLSDGKYKTWAVEMENPNAAREPTHPTYFTLYKERIEGAKPVSIPPKGRDARGSYIRYVIPEPIPWWRELLGI